MNKKSDHIFRFIGYPLIGFSLPQLYAGHMAVGLVAMFLGFAFVIGYRIYSTRVMRQGLFREGMQFLRMHDELMSQPLRKVIHPREDDIIIDSEKT